MGEVKAPSALELLKMKRDAAKADAERERLSEEDKEEARLRAEIAAFEEQSRAADREAVRLDLARREDAAREALGPKVPVKGLMSEDGAAMHSFVIRYAGTKPHTAWENLLGLSMLDHKDPKSGKKVSREDANKAYALALVYDWNGVRVVEGSKEYAALSALFDEFGGIASAICLEGRTLANAALEARKS